VPSLSDTHDLVIQDGHAPTRLGLAVLLRAQPWVGRCHLAADTATAIGLIKAHRPRVAVVDVSSAGGSTEVHCASLRREHAAMAIVLTSRCPRSAGGDAAGASTVLPAEAGAEEIVAAVHAAALGHRSEVARPPATPALTAREAQVLQRLATGATNREIADELHLSTDAIKKHTSALYRKLGVRNRTEAAAFA
jgi:DNA-binding NarL/FixJ family response regulator